MGAAAAAVEAAIASVLPKAPGPEGRLHEAMAYAALGPGKRLRPLLLIETGNVFSVPLEHTAAAAAAVEMLHAYSLVHDDLPCMDDDDLRRGRPTVHRKYDEAIAVLAGDALLTLAFEAIARPEVDPDPALRLKLVAGLARAAGAAGMVAGQAIDIFAETNQIDLEETRRLQSLKTGALISFACEAGGLLGRASAGELATLRAYADDIGLAFQIADDILDVEGEEEAVGKRLRKDAAAGKSTFVDHLGLAGAKSEAAALAEKAAARLASFDERADVLRALPAFIVTRRA